MKCLSCKQQGKHFAHKICPTCTGKGITRDDIIIKKESMTFLGDDANIEAGKYVEKMRRDYNISHVNFKAVENTLGKMDGMEVSWHRYELKKSGGSNGRKKANQSK